MPKLSPTNGRAPSLVLIQQTPSAVSVAPATSGPASANAGTSAVENDKAAHTSEGATATDEQHRTDDCQDRQGESAVVAAPAPGGEEEVRKSEPPATPIFETEVVVAAAQEVPGTAVAPAGEEEVREAEPLDNATPALATEAMAASAQEVLGTAEAQETATAHETSAGEAQAREMEECEKLVNMRAEKILLIKGN